MASDTSNWSDEFRFTRKDQKCLWIGSCFLLCPSFVSRSGVGFAPGKLPTNFKWVFLIPSPPVFGGDPRSSSYLFFDFGFYVGAATVRGGSRSPQDRLSEDLVRANKIVKVGLLSMLKNLESMHLSILISFSMWSYGVHFCFPVVFFFLSHFSFFFLSLRKNKLCTGNINYNLQ